MLRFNRPAEPSDFAKSVASARAAVANAVTTGADLKFPNRWSDFKQPYVDAQHGKCGFCESTIRATQPGDVEHFRPKACVTRVPATHQPWTQQTLPPEEDLHTPGYWWLAYAWTNYLLACSACNRTWKRNLFPVATVAPITSGCEASENGLLLDPFGSEVPEQHLRFDGEGRVFARRGAQGAPSAHGEATIETVGLHRFDLVRERARIAVRARWFLRQIATATTQAEADAHRRELQRLGARHEPFAGMVRSLVDDRLPGMLRVLWPDHL